MSWKILAAYRTSTKNSGVLLFELTTMGSVPRNMPTVGGKPEEVCGSMHLAYDPQRNNKL